MKILKPEEIDKLTDAQLEAYHHDLQRFGEFISVQKQTVKDERDTRAALAKLSPEDAAKLKAKHIRVHGQTQQSVAGETT